MNPFTAAAIFIPLSFALSMFASNQNNDSNNTVLLNEKEVIELAKNKGAKEYFLYLSYNSCVRGIVKNSGTNKASGRIAEVCNPILKE